MKTKILILNLFIAIWFPSMVSGQMIAVSEISADGIAVGPVTLAKMARLEMTKINKYTVLDEFDMKERLKGKNIPEDCYGKQCLLEKGKAMGVDYIMSGQVIGTSTKIIINLKIIDVKNETIKYTSMREFDDNIDELQRMLGIVIQDMHDIAPDEVIAKRLEFKNEVIATDNVGKLNNSGPRFGASYVAYGELSDFFTRSESQGGLDIYPIISNLGYQLEGEYIGTENFAALAEVIFNVGGMDQGKFIPSITLLNGFRFGKSGYEFAFGPSIGIKRTSMGLYSDGKYYTRSDWTQQLYREWENNPENIDPVTAEVYKPFSTPNSSIFSEQLDNRGEFKLNANWVVAVGRTFKAGSLNIPVNVYYSSNKYGGIVGLNLGFNMTNSKLKINQ